VALSTLRNGQTSAVNNEIPTQPPRTEVGSPPRAAVMSLPPNGLPAQPSSTAVGSPPRATVMSSPQSVPPIVVDPPISPLYTLHPLTTAPNSVVPSHGGVTPAATLPSNNGNCPKTGPGIMAQGLTAPSQGDNPIAPTPQPIHPMSCPGISAQPLLAQTSNMDVSSNTPLIQSGTVVIANTTNSHPCETFISTTFPSTALESSPYLMTDQNYNDLLRQVDVLNWTSFVPNGDNTGIFLPESSISDGSNFSSGNHTYDFSGVSFTGQATDPLFSYPAQGMTIDTALAGNHYQQTGNAFQGAASSIAGSNTFEDDNHPMLPLFNNPQLSSIVPIPSSNLYRLPSINPPLNEFQPPSIELGLESIKPQTQPVRSQHPSIMVDALAAATKDNTDPSPIDHSERPGNKENHPVIESIGTDRTGGRTRKPWTVMEVTPLTAPKISGPPPVWLTDTQGYLEAGSEDPVWKKCLEAWLKLETSNGYYEGTSVSLVHIVIENIYLMVS